MVNNRIKISLKTIRDFIKKYPHLGGILITCFFLIDLLLFAVLFWIFHKIENKASRPENCEGKNFPVTYLGGLDIKKLYPKSALDKSIEGKLELKFHIDEKGHIKNIEVINAQPVGVFEKNINESSFKMKFRPAYTNCAAVSSEYKMNIAFKMKD